MAAHRGSSDSNSGDPEAAYGNFPPETRKVAAEMGKYLVVAWHRLLLLTQRHL